jgi:hypothetical protein
MVTFLFIVAKIKWWSSKRIIYLQLIIECDSFIFVLFFRTVNRDVNSVSFPDIIIGILISCIDLSFQLVNISRRFCTAVVSLCIWKVQFVWSSIIGWKSSKRIIYLQLIIECDSFIFVLFFRTVNRWQEMV